MNRTPMSEEYDTERVNLTLKQETIAELETSFPAAMNTTEAIRQAMDIGLEARR
jgi:hypothetical protein